MMVWLTNTSGRCQDYVFAHDRYCAQRGACACTIEPGRHGRRVASSLTLASGVTSPALDETVLSLPDVARAVKRGELAVRRPADEPATTSSVPLSAPPATPTDSTRANKKKAGR
jgi:hypothetical protein